MKTKINKLLSVLIVVMVLGSLVVGLAVPAAAADGAWSVLNIPAQGALGSYIIAPTDGVASLDFTNSSYTNDVGPSLLTKNKDGSIMYINWDIDEGDQGSNLYKSTDGGRTWIRCSNTTDDLGDVQITQIVTSPQDANRVYVSTYEADPLTDIMGYQIYRSTDAGATFTRIVTPTDELAGNLPVFSLAVGYNGSHYLYIATTIPDADSPYIPDGDIFRLNDVFGGDWESTNYADNLPDRVVAKVFVSPNFATEAQPMVGALSTDGSDSYVSFSYGGAAWASVAGDDVVFAEDDDMLLFYGPGVLCPSGVGFPSDFDSRRSARDFFIGVSMVGSTVGDVYRIIATTSIPTLVGGGLDVTSIAVAGPAGNCKLLAAGTNLSGNVPARQIYHSENNGDSWTGSLKSPPEYSGYTNKFLVMDAGYATNGKAWVAVAADWSDDFDDSGVSQTLDFGVTWTDFSVLNTTIGQIQTITPSPAYATDTSLFMIASGDTQDSVWKWDGKYWTRVHVIPAGAASTSIIQCSPNFSADKTVFLAIRIGFPPVPDTGDVDSDGNTTELLYTGTQGSIFRATDTGFWFKPQVNLVPDTFDGAMLVLSSTKLVVGTGTCAAITANNGTTWDQIAYGGVGPITSFAVAADGKTLLLGDANSMVFLSADTGASWKKIPAATGTVTTTAGATNVAFDTAYATNNTIYAACAANDGIYSINAATGTSWGSINMSPATAGGSFNEWATVPGIQISKDGTLYVFDKTAAGATTVGGAADTFTILATGNATGSISIMGGSVSITNSSTAPMETLSAASATGPTVVSWTNTTGNGIIVVTQTNVGVATGTWTVDANASAAITSDVDGDAYVNNPAVANAPASFRLGDKATTTSTGAGSARLVLRALGAMHMLWDGLPSGFFPVGTAANLKGLWLNETTNGPQIWELESGATSRIWTYTDRLTGKTTINSPANNASTGRENRVTLAWTAMPTASNYQIQVATSNTFMSGVILDVSAGGTGYVLNGLESGTTYYWHVRSAHTNLTPAGKAASQWSDTWAFTMGLGAAEWDPFVPAERVNPIPASYNVPLRPTFLWNPADWATGYEFVLSKAADFSNPIYTFTGATALKITAFVADKDLEYGTDYYWKVTAISATSKSNTAYGSFRTMVQPTVAPPGPTLTVPAPVNITIPPQQNITPTWIWAIVIIGAVLVIAVIILIVTTRRVP